MKRWLPRYLARWNDGVVRVIHAATLSDARDFAYGLTCVSGVRCVDVVPLLPGGAQ